MVMGGSQQLQFVGSSKDTQIGEAHTGERRAMVIYSDSDLDSS